MGLDASYIKTLMERENITQAELARLTDIPQGTLSRILNGTTDCPTFANVTAIVKALHGSLDVMAGIVDEPNDKPMTMTERELYEKLIADKERQLRSINGILEQKQQWMRKLWRLLIVMIAVVGVMLVLDVSIGSVGFVRY
jgi:transcriptional regulator with XRE-family HTH domain